MKNITVFDALTMRQLRIVEGQMLAIVPLLLPCISFLRDNMHRMSWRNGFRLKKRGGDKTNHCSLLLLLYTIQANLMAPLNMV